MRQEREEEEEGEEKEREDGRCRERRSLVAALDTRRAELYGNRARSCGYAPRN